MKKVLLTGGTGFIGKRVCAELLGRDYDVYVVVHPNDVANNKEKENLHFLSCDLLDVEAVNELFSSFSFENLIHLAWYVGPKCHTADVNIDWVVATLNLLKIFKEHGGKCFTMAGTCSEYEYKYGYLCEDATPTNPRTLYGNGKNAVYNLASLFCAQNEISFKWPRIFNLYGPAERETRLMPSVIISCLKGEDVKVSDCLKFQDYLYVDDTACAIVDIFASDVEGAVNVCSSHPVQLRTIVEKIALITGFKGRILWGAIPAAFGDNLVVGNNEKLKSIGWSEKYTLDEGLAYTVDWWRKKLKETEK